MNGVILAIILDHAPTRVRLTNWLTTVRTAMLISIGLGATFLMPDAATRRTVFAVVFPLIMAHTVLRPGDTAGRLLELGPLRALGLMSFSLYLWQQLFFPPTDESAPSAFASVQQSAWSCPLALLCAASSFYMIERPMVALGRRFAGRRRTLP